jgi:hypothetical protein
MYINLKILTLVLDTVGEIAIPLFFSVNTAFNIIGVITAVRLKRF